MNYRYFLEYDSTISSYLEACMGEYDGDENANVFNDAWKIVTKQNV